MIDAAEAIEAFMSVWFVVDSRLLANNSKIRYDTRCYFNVRSKADISDAWNQQLKMEKIKTKK